jgi:transposase InsO family protein
MQHHRQQFPVDLMCQVLAVSRSGYYAWQARPDSPTAQRRTELAAQIRVVHQRSRQVYGAPRVHRELAAQGVKCARNTVAKVMRNHGIRSKMRKRFVVRTTDSRHAHPIAPNTLNRQFEQAAPNQAWAADITYIPTDEGWLYLAGVIDLCSRKLIGWATADHLRADLVEAALTMALVQRRPSGPVLHHSDRGVQYACDQYQALLKQNGLQPSMSRRGNCHDNAVMESFWGTLKTELVHHERYPNRELATQSLFEYIEVFYNRQRRHSALDYQTPHEFELSLN